jgi:regulator of replication initiation timing
MNHTCVLKIKNCIDGWIVENGATIGECRCVLYNAILKAYEYAKGEPEMMISFSKLPIDPRVKNATTGSIQSYKTLAAKITKNFPTLAAEQKKLYLYGNTGSGKSQFASSLLIEVAGKYQGEGLGFYLPARRFFNAVFDFSTNKQDLKAIFDKVRNIDTRLLIIDDIGAELSHVKMNANGEVEDNRLDMLLTEYNNLLREFQKHEGVLVITANYKPETLRQRYKQDKRLFDVTFQEGITDYFEFEDSQFRQKKKSTINLDN